jgi:hypothetical protein
MEQISATFRKKNLKFYPYAILQREELLDRKVAAPV